MQALAERKSKPLLSSVFLNIPTSTDAQCTASTDAQGAINAFR